MNKVKEVLFERLIYSILQTNDSEKISKAFSTKDIIFSAPIKGISDNSFDFWAKMWYKELDNNKKGLLKSIRNKFSKKPMSIFSVLSLLRLSKKTVVNTTLNKQALYDNYENNRENQSYISEELLVQDILNILQLGKGNYIKLTSKSAKINGIIKKEYHFYIKKIIPLLLCIELIKKTILILLGNVGQSIGQIFHDELNSFVVYISSIPLIRNFVELHSYLASSESEKIMSCGMLSSIVVSRGNNYLHALELSQKHGNPGVVKIGKKMIDTAHKTYLKYIQDWVMYGRLEDPHLEFFMQQNKVVIEYSLWWYSKYRITNERIPPGFSKQLLDKIVSTGRAFNFINEFNGTHAVINYEIFRKRKFDLTMIDYFFEKSMSSVLDLIFRQNWLLGHLEVIHDFLLFCRGDFFLAMFEVTTHPGKSEALTILSSALMNVTKGKAYTNPYNGEILTDRIDFKLRNEKETSKFVGTLIYKTSDVISTIIGRIHLESYEKISSFIWRLKCLRLLFSNKETVDLPVLNELVFENSSTLFKLISCLKNHMMFVVTIIIEWLMADVVLSSKKILLDKLKEAKTFDGVYSFHSEHVDRLMQWGLLSGEFAEQQTSIAKLIRILDSFLDKRQEILELLSTINEEYEFLVGRYSDIEIEKFYDQTKNSIDDMISEILTIKQQFNVQLETLFTSVTLEGSQELAKLSVRLKCCLTKA